MTKEIVKIIKSNPDEANLALQNTTSIIDRIEDISNKGILSTSKKFVSARSSYNGTTSPTGVNISALNTSIITTADNSYILYDLCMFYETNHDAVFVLKRIINGVTSEIASGNPSGLAAYGFAPSKYDWGDTSTTGSQIIYKYLDNPNVPAGTTVSYQIRFYGGNGGQLALNGVFNASIDSFYAERGSSSVILREIGL